MQRRTEPMTSPPSVDPRELRNALGTYPTGVTVVTTLDANGAFVGLTVNSFSSLSLDPPLVLWSLNVRSPNLAAFDRAPYFAVNVLAEEQVEISRHFAKRGARFERLEAHTGLGGVPLLAGCAAHIQCRTDARHNGGDHVLFIGRVERLAYDVAKRPLVFWGGRYHSAGGALL